MNYLGTPNFPMGWGDPTDTPQTTLYRERIARQRLESTHPRRVVARANPPRDESAVEKELRKLFEFDGGWLFTVAEKIVYGQTLVPGPQNIGNCVGYSHCMLLGAKVAHELLVEGDAEEVLGRYAGDSPVPYIPYSYGAGRVYVGGNVINGDGSLGEWQIKASMEHGFLPSDTPGLAGPLPQGTAEVGRDFGKNKATLDKWRSKAIVFDLLESEAIKDADTAKRLMTEQKVPLQIASNWGFEKSSWDSRYELEITQKSGSWAHQMQVVGCIEVKGAWFIIIRNQWGETYHKKVGHGVPPGCFAVTMETFKQWVPQSECASIGELKGRQLEPPVFPL